MAIAILDYQIGELLHESSNSRIYRALGLSDNQPVILKLLNQAYPSPEKIAQFQREYETTRSLNFPGIINAYRLERSDRQWVMVIEDFGGVSLKTIIQNQPLTLSQFLPIAINIAEILDLVHQQQIIHKDINPSNLVLNPNTQELKLIDFGISTQLSRENPTFRNPNLLEGTLLYIAPEQTGRMNRSVDYRSDFYSLGVTFYELLTGRVPFPSDDPLALVYSHLAQQPIPPHQLNTEIPEAISRIILKLMSKNAEDRYQSAYGLKRDLEECLRQWQNTEQIQPFPLATQDSSDRFQLPQKLYGRQQEIAELLSGFERVCSGGQTELMLVAGYSGIGKSALVQEVYKPITRQRGYFISGKFDQLQRDIPYASLVQAFRSLILQLLTESATQIATWREKLLTALGPNAQIIIDVIPELKAIIGEQPPIPELPGMEAENRFKLVFQNFIQVFTQAEHPLVVFLDDLQWSDNASLKLLALLMTTPASQYLYLIGAYRDNEVSSVHPLMLTLEELQKNQATVNQIFLTPLSLSDVTQLVADTLNTTEEIARPLAELVEVKTKGNPFFVNQFLSSLYKNKVLNFESDRRCWQWDIHQIAAQNITDNVVDLMVEQVKKLPETTQTCLKLAACIGYRFDLETLALVSQKSRSETAAALWEAISETLILPLGDDYKLMEVDIPEIAQGVTVEYKFAHDRIQQAAYSLIPETDKQAVHLQIGQLFLENTPSENREQNIFDIVHQLNLGREAIREVSLQQELVSLNEIAGKKAKASAAFKSALRYFQTAIELLSQNSWEEQYDLTLALYLEAIEAALFSGSYALMEEFSEVILQQAITVLDTVKVYELKIQGYVSQNELGEAKKSGLEILERLGMPLPEQPTPSDIGQAMTETRAIWAGKRISDLIDMPPMLDPYKLAASRVFVSLATPAAVGFPEIYPLVLLRMAGLFLQYGNTSQAPGGYGAYAILLCGVENDLESGYEFGLLSLNLQERLNVKEIETKTLHIFNTFIRHWKEPVRNSIKNFLQAYQSGLETGDILYGGWALWMYCVHSYWAGEELLQVNAAISTYSDEIIKLKQAIALRWMESFRESVFNLLTSTEEPWTLNSDTFDESSQLLSYQQAGDRIALCLSYLNKIMLCYLFERFPEAAENVALGEEYVGMAIAMHTVPLFNFYDSLTHLALYPDASEPEQQRILEKVTANQEKMQLWAQHAPMNYLHKYYLVEAERARVLCNPSDARDYYDRAIALAKENEYLNEEALAYELAARFYIGRNIPHLARFYLVEAHYAYQRWGATAKVKHLETRYPQLLELRTSTSSKLSTTTTSGSSSGETLDIATVLKASQAISSEIQLNKLLAQLLTLAIENAGAQKGVLILSDNNQLKIEAAKLPDREVQILESLPLETGNFVPPAIINYVARTQENVILANATQEGIFTSEPYILQQQTQSLLCAAIVNQGKLIGILYLENNLATGAFTQERIELLQVISAQAAISLENAQLYRTLEDKVIERTAQLAEANEEISALNELLKSDNLRMSAELDVTRQLQQKMLPNPEELQAIPGLEIAGFMEPADEIGGDYYDVLNHEGHIKIGIGDVTGHGLEAGMVMVMVQTAVRTLLVNNETDYVKFLNTINRMIHDNVKRMRTDKNLTLALLDYADGVLRITGQHEEVLVVRGTGEIERLDTVDLGFPVGLELDIADFITQAEVELNPGDGVVLYTDGIPEAENMAKEFYGMDRLCEVVSQYWQESAEAIRQLVIQDVREFIGEQKVFDDITLVVMKQR
ncbi:AAA family ATPase [Oscillatoria acuminata]|uniref:Putative ATPase n=1 Tax=Oscillatoria acuminata PCC 6304 TaxID=56110 RepID=K9THG9_9CYAN|nr:AAA family ATPase [Oscillatoria acuminata]AFY81995.1 putative ATPase [Oscillatoria acuminata PCC 6304]